MPGWAGVPLGYTAIYDPRRDQLVVVTVDSLLGHVGTFALTLSAPTRWRRVVPFGMTPDLSYSSAIYDPVGDRLIMYGGLDVSDGGGAVGAIWSLSLGTGARWAPLEARGVAPSSRMEHSAIYDSEHRAMVIYGGRASMDGPVLGDAWSLDLVPTPRWQRIGAAGKAPASRTGAAAIYDARWHRMVIMGGRPSKRITPADAFQDVWALSLGKPSQWHELHPAGQPPGVFSLPITFADPSGNRMLVTSYSGSFVWELAWGSNSPSPSGAELDVPFDRVEQSAAHEPLLRLSSQGWIGDGITARLSLVGTTSATLALYDATGRHIWDAGQGLSGAGTHDMTIRPAASPPAGIYFLRATQGQVSQVLKVVRLR